MTNNRGGAGDDAIAKAEALLGQEGGFVLWVHRGNPIARATIRRGEPNLVRTVTALASLRATLDLLTDKIAEQFDEKPSELRAMVELALPVVADAIAKNTESFMTMPPHLDPRNADEDQNPD